MGPGKGRKRLRRPVRIDPDRFWCEPERARLISAQILQNGKIRLQGFVLCSQETDVLFSPEADAVKNVSEFFNNALNLKAVKVRDFMVPRTEIIAIDEEDSINDLKKIISKTGYTKVIVYQSSIDNVIGYCHGLSLFTNPNKINDILKPIHYVNETNLASDLLLKFISDQINIAVVIDEYGGTSGIITLEDIIEEIFGEIIDEFDDLDLLENKVYDN